MIRLLTTPRWLGAMALAAVFATTCIFLGRWQWGRYLEASARAAAVVANYGAPVRSLSSVFGTSTRGAPSTPSGQQEWTRLSLAGRYDPAGQLLVRNRPREVVYGYEVVVPFHADNGRWLLIDRGWVPNAERADVLPTVPPPPGGRIEITGWLRQGEPDLGRDLPPGQLASINLSEAAHRTGRPLLPAYLILQTEQIPQHGSAPTRPAPVMPPRPAPLLPPQTGTGPHFAYAIQWWLAAPVGFVLVGVFARREAAELRTDSGRGRASAAGSSPPPRPKKIRIWDEEDA